MTARDRFRNLFLGLALAGAGVLTPTIPSAAAQEADSDEEIRLLAETVATATEPRFAWNDAVRLVDYDDRARQFAVDALGSPDATNLGRVALGRVLLELGQVGQASQALLAVAGSDASVELRVEAVRLLGESGDDEYEEDVVTLVEEALDPRLRAALAKCLWVLTKGSEAKQLLKSEMLRSEDFEIRVEGALALAEIGDFGPEVKEVLTRIRKEPTHRGRLAEALLQMDAMRSIRVSEARRTGATTAPETPSGKDAAEQRLIAEALKTLQQFYVDPVDLRERMAEIWQGAVRGLIEAVGDPHTMYQSPDERESWDDHLSKKYGGIGAYVAIDEGGYFSISRPMFGGPAWNARLKSGDRVLTVDGWETLEKDLSEIVKRLRGEPGKPVSLMVYRQGWEDARPYELVRDLIRVPTVYTETLPGDVGFIAVDTFGEDTAGDFRSALAKYEAAGAPALVLDLRYNSGGYLSTAINMADAILPRGRLVVETRGRPEESRGQPYLSRGTSTEWSRSVPMVVLVNGGSASASEILSGCLQRNRPNTRVVGTRTYGKGSVQNLFRLYTQPFAESFTDANRNGRWDDEEAYIDANENGLRDEGEQYNDSNRDGTWTPAEDFVDANKNNNYDCPAVKVTIARYYIGHKVGGYEFSPDRRQMIVGSRRVWLGGVEPDVAVEETSFEGWRNEEAAKLEEKGLLDAYFESHMPGHEEHFLHIAEQSSRDPLEFPGFDEFYNSLDTQLSRQDVWFWLHVRLRAKASDLRGSPLMGDWAADTQLQAAIRELSLMDEARRIQTTPLYAFIQGLEFPLPPTYDPDDLAKARPVK